MAAIDGIGFGRKASIMNGVARATECLVGAPQWRRAMNEVLATLGASAGVSRVYLFERLTVPGDHMRVSQTFEWVASGVAPQIDHPELRDFDLGLFPRWTKRLRAGEPVFGDVTDFPDEERPLLEEQGIVSILVQPVSIGGTLWGFLGFDACVGPQRWEPVEIDALRIASLVLGSKVEAERRENEARQSHKMEALGRMAGGVAHDFNNILAVVMGSLDLVRRTVGDPEKADTARRHLSVLDQVTEQGARLTRQLLDFARQSAPTARATDPQAVVGCMADVLTRVAGPSVAVEIDGLEHASPVSLDAASLERVVMNLVANARDAMPNGGVIQVRLRTLDATDAKVFGDVLPPGTYTLLSVRDTGEGIPGELRDKIFEPFVTTKDTGHGLGLSTVYGAVMGAKGHIAVTSERGEGTEMRVYLPIACAPPDRASSARVASVVPTRRPNRRIAVCDDNAVFRAWVADVLTEAGYDVIVPADARAYLASPKEIPEIDLLVTDVRMPGVDGPTLRKRLRELLPGTPTVYMSGFSEGLLAQAGKERPDSGRAEAFLDKPFSREELLATVDGVLAARG